MLHEKAGLAHELVGAFGGHLGGALGPLLGVRRLLLFLLVLLFFLDDQAILQDDVQAGLDVVGVEDLILLFLLLFLLGDDGLARRGRLLVLLVEHFLIEGVVFQGVVFEDVVILAESLEILLVEVLGLLLFEFFVVFVGHPGGPFAL